MTVFGLLAGGKGTGTGALAQHRGAAGDGGRAMVELCDGRCGQGQGGRLVLAVQDQLCKGAEPLLSTCLYSQNLSCHNALAHEDMTSFSTPSDFTHAPNQVPVI